MRADRHQTTLDIATWAGFVLFATSAVIVAICLPEISKTFDADLSASGWLETVRNLLVLAVLMLAGLLAQRWGKKRFLTLGQYLIAAALLLASVSQNYMMLVLSLMLLGIGGGFSEALLNPLVVDIHRRDAGKYLNIGSAFYSAGVVMAALLFGQMLTLGYSWRSVFQVAAVGAVLVALLFTVQRFPRTLDGPDSERSRFMDVLSLSGFWLFAAALFLAGSVESALTFWSRSYVDTYLSDVPSIGALAVVVFAGAMAAGRLLAAYLANRIGLSNIVIGSALLGIVASTLMPIASTISSFYALLGIAGFATASLWPSLLAEADRCLPVNTTVLFVLLASIGIAGFGFTPWLIGIVGDSSDLRAAFATIPALFGVLLLLLIVERRRYPQTAVPDKMS